MNDKCFFFVKNLQLLSIGQLHEAGWLLPAPVSFVLLLVSTIVKIRIHTKVCHSQTVVSAVAHATIIIFVLVMASSLLSPQMGYKPLLGGSMRTIAACVCAAWRRR